MFARRIKKDVEDMENAGDGLYYFPTEDITEGYGLIIGPNGSPYDNGFYIIRFKFPVDYPYVPPMCNHLSVNNLRLSPNFHDMPDDHPDNGKVCLSRLNTWSADDNGKGKWTPHMNIKYILYMIQTQVFTNNALDNEPPYDHSIKHPDDLEHYDHFVEFHNFRSNVVDIIDMLECGRAVDLYGMPTSVAYQISALIKSYVRNNIDWYVTRLLALKNTHDGEVYTCNIYQNSSCMCNYLSVIRDFKRVYTKISVALKNEYQELLDDTGSLEKENQTS